MSFSTKKKNLSNSKKQTKSKSRKNNSRCGQKMRGGREMSNAMEARLAAIEALATKKYEKPSSKSENRKVGPVHTLKDLIYVGNNRDGNPYELERGEKEEGHEEEDEDEEEEHEPVVNTTPRKYKYNKYGKKVNSITGELFENQNVSKSSLLPTPSLYSWMNRPAKKNTGVHHTPVHHLTVEPSPSIRRLSTVEPKQNTSVLVRRVPSITRKSLSSSTTIEPREPRENTNEKKKILQKIKKQGALQVFPTSMPTPHTPHTSYTPPTTNRPQSNTQPSHSSQSNKSSKPPIEKKNNPIYAPCTKIVDEKNRPSPELRNPKCNWETGKVSWGYIEPAGNIKGITEFSTKKVNGVEVVVKRSKQKN